MLRLKNIELVKEKIQGSAPQKIVITTHHKPDGDALGSSLGLYHYLIQYGHQVQVISPTDYPYNLAWMPANDTVWEFEKTENKSREAIANADLIFCLDFNRLNRINQMEPLVKESKALKILIDHHLEPENFEDITFADTSAVATAELIYTFITHIGDEQKINIESAKCLYTGILTDSGSFRFNSTTPTVHIIASKLIALGVKPLDIFELIYDDNTENRMRFIGYCMNKKMVMLPEYNAAYISVTRDELKEYKITTGDTEGLVNYPLSIKGIKLVALIIDRTERVKLSLRSKGDIAVNELCSQYFNGGGHKNASGGHSNGTLDETVQTFLQMLAENKNKLN
jgi:phosphoesterase RecJ-like protein